MKNILFLNSPFLYFVCGDSSEYPKGWVEQSAEHTCVTGSNPCSPHKL